MDENQLFNLLKKDCSPYLDELKKCQKGIFLLRGYFYQIEIIKEFTSNLNSRKPKNMPPKIHEEINNYFYPKYHWKIRNGIFCYAFDILNNQPIDLGYGIFYLIFPKGKFTYVYSPEHFDLFGYVNQSHLALDELISGLHFIDDNFCNALHLRKEYHGFSNEVSINAKSYYLVNTSFANNLTDQIWTF